MGAMTITFFGVRGSYPVPDRRMSRFGGNSASVLLETSEAHIILDAGTGIIRAGKYLQQRFDREPTPKKIHIFLSHLHIDHIMGLPFFSPMFDPACHILIYCPKYETIDSRQAVQSLFLPPYSPITLEGIKAKVDFVTLEDPEKDRIGITGSTTVDFIRHSLHPLLGVAIYRVSHQKKRVVYATDVESPDGFDPDVVRFITGADVLIHDSQYQDSDYFRPARSRKGFCHSTVSRAVLNALQCEVGKLFLFHFDPDYTDATVEKMLAKARVKFKKTYLAQELRKIKI
jgi:ribonuclease BN (tRNA processing enzyme)